jgi:hydrogenase expression/formation protein HypD
MKYVDEYRDRKIAEQIVQQIRRICHRKITLMEVCGTHTVAIHRHGLQRLLPDEIALLSGPGCPVCVTPIADIDRAIFLSKGEITLATFGDLIRVPGSTTSLLKQRGLGAAIRIVYSAYDALTLAQQNPDRSVVFLGVGFETTAPTVAAVIKRAQEEGVDNFSVLSMHKVLPPALLALVESPQVKIDGFICPGHVSTIIGTGLYQKVADGFHIPCVVTGFEPVDILQAIALLTEQIEKGEAKVEIQYRRAVSPQGNLKAKAVMEEVFEPCDSTWRGFGVLPKSGLKLKAPYRQFDAERIYDIPSPEGKEPPGCICGDILRGIRRPPDCPLYKKVCTPENPVGACMVASEGTCAAYYHFEGSES